MFNTVLWIRILGAHRPNDSTLLDRIAMADSFDTQGPTFIIEPQQHLEFTNIVDNHVDCTARGSPPPKIEWLMLDNSPVTTIPRVSYSNLVFHAIISSILFFFVHSVERVLVAIYFRSDSLICTLRMIIIVCTEYSIFSPSTDTSHILSFCCEYFDKIYARRVKQ